MVADNLNVLERHLAEWSTRAKLAMAHEAFRALPHLCGSALQIAASAFAPGPIPHFASTDVRTLAPTLNDDLLELYGRAAQVLANRFAFFNSSQSFDAGIDWEPPQSPSWRAELHACDYALDLACTFRISGDQVYARQLRYVIAHWIACNPPLAGMGWRPQVLARRMRNWMLAADFARSDWERDAEFSAVVANSLALQTSFLLSQLDSLPSPVVRFDASRALLCASRFFTGGKAREAATLGGELLAREIAAASPEPWPQARLWRAQTLMEWNLWADSGNRPAFLSKDLRAALDHLEAVLAPDGCLPLLGQEARLAADELADLAALAAVRLQSPVWKSLAGKFGILPYLYLGEPGKACFERLEGTEWTPQDCVGAGAEILRLTGPRKSALMVSASRPAGKQHQDFASYELALNGQRVVVDSGGFAPDVQEYFPAARAHNLLLIDGQEPRWDNARGSAGANPEYSPECQRLRVSDPGFAFLGIEHERVWFRLQNNAWLVLDGLRGQGLHRCLSLIHFYPTYDVTERKNGFQAKSRASSVAVLPISGTRPVASISRGDHPRQPGWYSPEHGAKLASTVIALEWIDVELPWLGGVLITGDADKRPPDAEIQPGNGRVRLEYAGRTYDLQIR